MFVRSFIAQFPVRAIISITAAIMVACSIAWRIAGETGCAVSEEKTLRPVRVCSSFSSRASLEPAKVGDALNVPVFPGAIGARLISNIDTAQSGGTAATLLVLDLTSTSKAEDVASWYSNALRGNPKMTEGECISFMAFAEQGMEHLFDGCAGKARLYVSKGPAGTSGVVLFSTAGITTMRLFLFSQKNSGRKK